MITSFTDLLELAKSKGPKKIAVAVAEDHEVLEAVKAATDLKIVEPILVGNKEKIENIAKEIEFDLQE